MKIENGIWHLGNDGRLQFKASVDAALHLTSVKTWIFNVAQRETAWFMAIEASALGADPEQIAELVMAWKLTNDEAVQFAEHNGIRLYENGGRWYASYQRVNPDDRTEGRNALDALVNLARPSLVESES